MEFFAFACFSRSLSTECPFFKIKSSKEPFSASKNHSFIPQSHSSASHRNSSELSMNTTQDQNSARQLSRGKKNQSKIKQPHCETKTHGPNENIEEKPHKPVNFSHHQRHNLSRATAPRMPLIQTPQKAESSPATHRKDTRGLLTPIFLFQPPFPPPSKKPNTLSIIPDRVLNMIARKFIGKLRIPHSNESALSIDWKWMGRC